jgi:hypothetical protein
MAESNPVCGTPATGPARASPDGGHARKKRQQAPFWSQNTRRHRFPARATPTLFLAFDPYPLRWKTLYNTDKLTFRPGDEHYDCHIDEPNGRAARSACCGLRRGARLPSSTSAASRRLTPRPQPPHRRYQSRHRARRIRVRPRRRRKRKQTPWQPHWPRPTAGQRRRRAGVRHCPHRADRRSGDRGPGDPWRNGGTATQRRAARSRGRGSIRTIRDGPAQVPQALTI